MEFQFSKRVKETRKITIFTQNIPGLLESKIFFAMTINKLLPWLQSPNYFFVELRPTGWCLRFDQHLQSPKSPVLILDSVFFSYRVKWTNLVTTGTCTMWNVTSSSPAGLFFLLVLFVVEMDPNVEPGAHQIPWWMVSINIHIQIDCLNWVKLNPQKQLKHENQWWSLIIRII